MNLIEGCRLLENLELIPVNILSDSDLVSEFCSKHRIHASQTLFSPKKINEIKKMLYVSNDFILINDLFKIKFLFAMCEGTLIAYGPYCTELLSTDEVSILLSHVGINDIDAESLSKQRSRYTVRPQQNVQYYLNMLLSEISGNSKVHGVQTMNLLPSELSNLSDDDAIIPKDIHVKLVREHYSNEQRLIDSITAGDYEGAVETWRFLHSAVSYNNIGHTLEIAKISAAVTRTLLRIGAINAGLPPEINDYISGNSTRILQKSRSIDAINLEHERLIREYCDVISEYKSSLYSTLVMSVKYLIENEYDKPLTLNSIATELSCSSSNLAHQFKREMDVSPMAYLNHVRMSKAASSLTKSNDSVQEIAASVGILDSNYFVKCFKREFGVTPSMYRKTHATVV